jgi:hypothetical protein
MIDDQLLNMINEIVSDTIMQEKEEHVVDAFSPSHQQKFLDDSFDMEESECVSKRHPQYDYSPEYEIYIDDLTPQDSKPKHEESKYEMDTEEDMDDNCISFNVDQYSLDVSKLTTKMEDIGYSPFKQQKNRQYNTEIDAICIHCEEFVNSKNIEIHSQYWMGNNKNPSHNIRESMNKKSMVDLIGYNIEADTIPRVNQKLYKLIKSLKHKEVEWIGDTDDITFVHSLSSLCKEIMVNNIDLEKLERIGERLKDWSDNYEKNRNASQRSDSLLITSQILSQVYDKKLELVRQEDEYSSAFGGFENTSSENYPANSLGSPEFNIFDQSVRMHEETDEYDELEKQEQEIKKWKGIYQEMSRRLQESMLIY